VPRQTIGIFIFRPTRARERGHMNREEIKALAKERGCREGDLYALAPQNDPFYVGTDSHLALAKWFMKIWNEAGYTAGVHLRRVHYRIVVIRPPILLPNGTPYENTRNCWAALCEAGKYARYLGMIDPDAFDDRKHSKPIINLRQREEELGVAVTDELEWSDLSFPPFPDLPDYSIQGFEGE
jgi:hypothetical protein